MHLTIGFFGSVALLFSLDSIDRMRIHDSVVFQSKEMVKKITNLDLRINSYIYGDINQRKGLATFNYRIIVADNDRICTARVQAHARRVKLDWQIQRLFIDFC